MEGMCLASPLLNQNCNQYVVKMYATQLVDLIKTKVDNKWEDMLMQLYQGMLSRCYKIITLNIKKFSYLNN
jgi:general stress protein 26